ncbi:MAG TPA: DUF418 domain-containing protein, partial [Chitinophagaceae bacterium]|nr:DUF418 domain-containing protein [Chitinophagaceae bacterium]
YGYTNSLSDEIISWFKYIFIESRMYTMLIIIFGIGFHVQLEKAKQHATSLVPVFTRRLIGLLVIGFVHAILLSKRDILMFYAIAGVVLLLVRKATVRQLLLFMGILFFIVTPLIQYNVANVWPKAAALVEPNDYPDYVQFNWQWFKLYHQVYGIYIEMLFHFMLGFMISKAGIYQKIKTNKKLRKKLMIITVISSIVMIPFMYFWLDNILSGLNPKTLKFPIRVLISLGFRSLWQIWMLVSVTLYGTILISLKSSGKWKRMFEPLAAFGQMALSNYLIQSLALVPYFLLTNKFKTVAPTEGFILFIFFFVLQLVFSTWWMKKYTMGPFEWVLRSFTYWKWQKIKRPIHHQFNNEKQMITVSSPQFL